MMANKQTYPQRARPISTTKQVRVHIMKPGIAGLTISHPTASVYAIIKLRGSEGVCISLVSLVHLWCPIDEIYRKIVT